MKGARSRLEQSLEGSAFELEGMLMDGENSNRRRLKPVSILRGALDPRPRRRVGKVVGELESRFGVGLRAVGLPRAEGVG